MEAGTCIALLISAIASGQGKTTLTAALARRAQRAGLNVSLFKMGPDFIDPTILERCVDQPVHQLDLWMCGPAHCHRLLRETALRSDVILVEGAMGLYDGSPSSADLARELSIPVALVIDGSAMAETFGAIAWGLHQHQDAPRIVAAMANRVNGAGHARLLSDGLPRDMPLLGSLSDNPRYAIPERHLGLLPAAEIDDLLERIDAAATAFTGEKWWKNVAPTCFPARLARSELPRLLQHWTIGVARDAAFSFVYHSNLETLIELGAKLKFFSPLLDSGIPDVDALYLPGGYPELHAQTISANRGMLDALREHHRREKPIVAECGGMMILMTELVDLVGKAHSMTGLLPGTAVMRSSVQAIAHQSIDSAAGAIRGHTFHHSELLTELIPSRYARDPRGGRGEKIFIHKALFASYVHLYFASNPQALAALFRP